MPDKDAVQLKLDEYLIAMEADDDDQHNENETDSDTDSEPDKR